MASLRNLNTSCTSLSCVFTPCQSLIMLTYCSPMTNVRVSYKSGCGLPKLSESAVTWVSALQVWRTFK